MNFNRCFPFYISLARKSRNHYVCLEQHFDVYAIQDIVWSRITCDFIIETTPVFAVFIQIKRESIFYHQWILIVAFPFFIIFAPKSRNPLFVLINILISTQYKTSFDHVSMWIVDDNIFHVFLDDVKHIGHVVSKQTSRQFFTLRWKRRHLITYLWTGLMFICPWW